MADDDATNDNQFQVNNPADTNPMQGMQDNQQMPGHDATPAAPADDVSSGQVGAQDPATDSNVDGDQQYQEGTQAATSVDPPAEPAVTDYTPPAVDDQQGDTPQQ